MILHRCDAPVFRICSNVLNGVERSWYYHHEHCGSRQLLDATIKFQPQKNVPQSGPDQSERYHTPEDLRQLLEV